MCTYTNKIERPRPTNVCGGKERCKNQHLAQLGKDVNATGLNAFPYRAVFRPVTEHYFGKLKIEEGPGHQQVEVLRIHF